MTIHPTPEPGECITCTRTLCDLPHTCGKSELAEPQPHQDWLVGSEPINQEPDMATTRHNWQRIDLTAIVMRHLFGNVLIVPCIDPEGGPTIWRRCDTVRFKPWHPVLPGSVVDEVEAAWESSEVEVEIWTHDLTLPLDPFSI